MITRQEWQEARDWAWEFVRQSGVVVRAADKEKIEVADLGLSDLATTGLQILTLVSTEWIAVKLLILRPHQLFPQHRHPPSPTDNYPGKEETFRGQAGLLYLYVEGPESPQRRAKPPAHRRDRLTIAHEIVLGPGDQYTCPPNVWQWFQAGPEGAVVWSFSSRATDAADEYLEPDVVRETRIVDALPASAGVG
jgi:D-lyxose ketol-isomerase